MLVAVDHVQLAAPAGSEPRLRAFHEGVLGMTEIPKPRVSAARGGCRFAAGGVPLHLGVEADGPARKAHPGLRASGIHDYAARLEKRGAPVVRDGHLPGHRRFATQDPVGNRPEFPEPLE
ncbi:VOC family protein [Streptomyces sp. NPDC127092]|uniref:VOC family protein n=1 Tax=Streptomyces sp. NPDC127092 TaxID=3347135 RepID=UPI0036595DB0